ncbi:hypothetical protein ACFL1A_00235, partial [Patescibacteria group bacterium]
LRTVITNTGTNQVSATKLSLEYDVNSIRSVEVSPGPFLPNATILEKKLDKNNGLINYSLGTLKPTSGEGVLVYVMGDIISGSNALRVDFLPETQVAAIGQKDTVLIKSTGGTIVLGD